ncbi:hypothetical protein HYFRA_00007340 [Hymenoscyphus fraxineus]|uniref:N-acetyltransferase domain-containing protein n=1 Tax=Hymenoscyphus fraxineus TaxID=746836 RepID=A0A9N9PG96_9HELO|nr:hypothetical protein HYFRA_00007340 [Hymenoscyphus fraxineus]
MTDPFRSQNLLYRLVDPEVDEPFFRELQVDPLAQLNSNPRVPKPPSKESALEYMKGVEDSLLGLIICLPGPEPTSETVSIGTIHLSQSAPGMEHHRFTYAGINIIKRYQGQSYGTEAIKWILEWAFNSAGLHRVGIRVAEYNSGARRLYEKLGFTQEGVTREMLWREGRWWDDIQLSMLSREWMEKYGAIKQVT